jgi:ABC-type transporter Mla subunit MlaD
MQVPFSLEELLALLTLTAAGVSAFAVTRQRTADLEGRVERAEAALENLKEVAATMATEMAETRRAINSLGESLVRVEARVDMSIPFVGRHPRGDRDAI